MITISDNRHSIYVKIFIISFYMNGIITHPKRLYRWIHAGVFQLMMLMGFIKSLACFFSEGVGDYHTALFLSETLSAILWYTVFLQKKRLFNFIIHLSCQKVNAFENRIISILFGTAAIVVFPPTLIFLISILNIKNTFQEVPLDNTTTCRSFWLSRDNTGNRVILWLYNGIDIYKFYSVSFSCFITFSICGILVMKRLSSTEKLIPFVSSSAEWRELKFYVSALTEMDKIFSFPLFLLMAKISVDVFNLLSRSVVHETRSGAKRFFSISAPPLVAWFLAIVILGDLIQNRCLNLLNSSFERLRQVTSVENLDYYEYKKMKSSLNLTIWKIFKINRTLLLTAFTFIVTYGVIIAQLKMNPFKSISSANSTNISLNIANLSKKNILIMA